MELPPERRTLPELGQEPMEYRRTSGMLDEMPAELGFYESGDLKQLRRHIKETMIDRPPARQYHLDLALLNYDTEGQDEARWLVPYNPYAMAGFSIQRLQLYMNLPRPEYVEALETAERWTQEYPELRRYTDCISALILECHRPVLASLGNRTLRVVGRDDS